MWNINFQSIYYIAMLNPVQLVSSTVSFLILHKYIGQGQIPTIGAWKHITFATQRNTIPPRTFHTEHFFGIGVYKLIALTEFLLPMGKNVWQISIKENSDSD